MKMPILGDYFNGKFHLAETPDEMISKKAPSDTNTSLWDAPVFYSHMDEVVLSAQKGYEYWKDISVEKRIAFLKEYKHQVLLRAEEIALAIAWETGKPLWESRTEASAVASKIDVTIDESLRRIEPQVVQNILPSLNGHTVFRPLGPCLIIGPYNFPCHLANGQILSALLAGNSIIFKPSEKTVYSAQILIECFHKAHFPKGVINFINGTVKTPSELVKRKEIKGVFFTGSHGVGLKILDATYRQLDKMVALEMGGRNCTVINDYQDEEHIFSEILKSAYLSTGQRCTSTSIAFIKRELFENFSQKFSKLAHALKVGHSVLSKEDPFMGPLVDEQALEVNENFHHFTLEHGGEAILPFKRLARLNSQYPGHYITPSLYRFSSTPSHDFFQPEIFGPHLSLIPYDDFEEVLHLVNSTPYGLAASLFTQNKKLYERAKQELRVGIFNLNRSTVGASSKLPFGGLKNSGNFRPAAVSMIDHCVSTLASLETFEGDSKLSSIPGLDI